MNRSLPKYGSIERWVEESGVGRRKTYDMLAAGQLRAVKNGKRTLIDFDHGFDYLSSLPAAVIRPQRQNRSKNAA
jgi:hypothetical protein